MQGGWCPYPTPAHVIPTGFLYLWSFTSAAMAGPSRPRCWRLPASCSPFSSPSPSLWIPPPRPSGSPRVPWCRERSRHPLQGLYSPSRGAFPGSLLQEAPPLWGSGRTPKSALPGWGDRVNPVFRRAETQISLAQQEPLIFCFYVSWCIKKNSQQAFMSF